ncbi:hypothetical protein [Comamonas aquatica]|uniref:hypothetical protein n=1 Tax=Comamonas aquatica TaxID=225991 RepID=UPI0024471AA9|nr:hypothetical protein [Comamonas aquatica]MDH1673977.1 hypothetical protein [Comamonas aquatica]MDH1677161.1 hypothetical protein [Comamonas aquatica]
MKTNDEIGASVEPLRKQAAAPQEEAIAEIVSASHDQAEFGERAINFLRDFQHLEYGTKLYPAPQAVQAAVPEAIEQMAVDRYKVVPSHESMFHRWAVVADNGAQQLYIGREGECQNMARKFMGAFLDGAFVAMQNATPAHPAEGVPAQCPNINEPRGCWRVACQLGGKCREPERSATQPAAQGLAALTPAARDVLAERKRQIETEGWKPERDDVYDTGEMALAAACYAAHSASCAAIKAPHTARGVFVRTRSAQDFVGEMWPWSADWWKPSGHRRNLEKAAALILAEIERIDRAALAAQAKQGGAANG